MSSNTTLTSTDSDEAVHPIIVNNLGKCHQIYATPADRLKQALWKGRRKFYREFWALRNINLEIKTGETLAIVGRNGSGKSTLLQLICGTLSPTEGSVQTRGTIAALLELGSGFNPEFTGIENVFLNASLLGLTQEQIKSRLDDIQAFADIGDFVHQPVKTYSSGMLVRLAFAVIAHVDPTVLIVDEALSVGDAVFGQRCMRFIRRFKERGTLLFVSHDLNAVASLCERAVWIDGGNLRMDAEAGTILTAYTRYCFEESNAEIKRTEQTSVNAEIKEDRSDEPLAGKTTDIETASGETHERLPLDNAEKEAYEIAHWDDDRDYGNRNATITEVTLYTEAGEPTLAPLCGEKVTLQITAVCNRLIESFVGGFIVRDKTGQIIFGATSLEHEQIRATDADTVCLRFDFEMPILLTGSYSLSAAVSSGDTNQYEVMHYKPDVLTLTPNVGGRFVHGVFAIAEIVMSSEIHAGSRANEESG
jgi:lipopolysaccharide transport system ATP-binding protein